MRGEWVNGGRSTLLETKGRGGKGDGMVGEGVTRKGDIIQNVE